MGNTKVSQSKIKRLLGDMNDGSDKIDSYSDEFDDLYDSISSEASK